MIQSRTVDYAKEIDDVTVLLIAVVRDIRAGKGISELAADVFPKLVQAISAVDQVPDELKTNRKVALQTIGYRTGELTDALL